MGTRVSPIIASDWDKLMKGDTGRYYMIDHQHISVEQAQFIKRTYAVDSSPTSAQNYPNHSYLVTYLSPKQHSQS
jgi:hypothetical protein